MEKHIALPYEMVCAADVDELNFLAARLEQLDPAEAVSYTHLDVYKRQRRERPLTELCCLPTQAASM